MERKVTVFLPFILMYTAIQNYTKHAYFDVIFYEII